MVDSVLLVVCVYAQILSMVTDARILQAGFCFFSHNMVKIIP